MAAATTRIRDDVRYGYAVGRVRVLEGRLLQRPTFERLLDAPDLREQKRILAETHVGRYLESVESAEDVERGLAYQVGDWMSLLPEYLRTIEYTYAWLAGYLEQPSPRDYLMILIGDHQPASSVTGPDAPWDVPVHVITSRPELVERFRALGFQPGLEPRRPVLGGMHELTWLLADAFDTNCDAAQCNIQYRRDAFDALDHAGRDGSEKQFGRVEGIRVPGHIGVESDLGIFAPGNASVLVGPFGLNAKCHCRAVHKLPPDVLSVPLLKVSRRYQFTYAYA